MNIKNNSRAIDFGKVDFGRFLTFICSPTADKGIFMNYQKIYD